MGSCQLDETVLVGPPKYGDRYTPAANTTQVVVATSHMLSGSAGVKTMAIMSAETITASHRHAVGRLKTKNKKAAAQVMTKAERTSRIPI